MVEKQTDCSWNLILDLVEQDFRCFFRSKLIFGILIRVKQFGAEIWTKYGQRELKLCVRHD